MKTANGEPQDEWKYPKYILIIVWEIITDPKRSLAFAAEFKNAQMNEEKNRTSCRVELRSDDLRCLTLNRHVKINAPSSAVMSRTWRNGSCIPPRRDWLCFDSKPCHAYHRWDIGLFTCEHDRKATLAWPRVVRDLNEFSVSFKNWQFVDESFLSLRLTTLSCLLRWKIAAVPEILESASLTMNSYKS